MNITDLYVMQDGLRLPLKEMQDMCDFVANGGVFDKAKRKIAIVSFGGSDFFIRDGTHRVVSIFLMRESQVLLPDEFQFEEFTFEQFNTPNLDPDIWFVTPFDPRQEVRKSDFFWFKDAVRKSDNPEKYIKDYRSYYSTPRRNNHTIKDFAEILSSQLGLSTMKCCKEFENRIADPEEEDRRSGRFIFDAVDDRPVQMWLEGKGEMVEFKFCPFCGNKL